MYTKLLKEWSEARAERNMLKAMILGILKTQAQSVARQQGNKSVEDADVNIAGILLQDAILKQGEEAKATNNKVLASQVEESLVIIKDYLPQEEIVHKIHEVTEQGKNPKEALVEASVTKEEESEEKEQLAPQKEQLAPQKEQPAPQKEQPTPKKKKSKKKK